VDSISELLGAGLSVTLIGMAVVFILLSALVGILHLMSALSGALTTDSFDAASSIDTDSELVGVIGAAIHEYRRRRSSEA
jgi:sodium pump decarboxylase gamma subunit